MTEEPQDAATEPGRPTPRPTPAAVPTPAALANRPPLPTAPRTPLTPPAGPSESARFGRVAEDGAVFVTEGGTERAVGSYPDATNDEALQYFARKYDELFGQADLLEQRLANSTVPAKEAAEALASLTEHTAEPAVVGDLAALRRKVDAIRDLLEQRRATEAAERAAAKEAATAEREAIVAEAEGIAATDEASIQWRPASERMRALLEEWKAHQRGSARLDKSVENALWQRFSHARNAFDKVRRSHFGQLEESRSSAKQTKEALAAEAEFLSSSTDWNATARAFKQLMDRWRSAGRAARADDDALWERFRTAQDAFFQAKDAVAAAEDESYRANLVVKEGLLTEAKSLLPIADLAAAKSSLRSIQERWEAAGRVPRADLDRIERAMREVEQAVREADDKRWQRTNPELAARASSMVTQLEASLESLRADLAKAEGAGNAKKAAELSGKIATKEAWLSQAQAGLEDAGS
ncbi:MAG: DUF349 domain-containing protein [Nostocoides sp.]